jgi:hypothetical protein
MISNLQNRRKEALVELTDAAPYPRIQHEVLANNRVLFSIWRLAIFAAVTGHADHIDGATPPWTSLKIFTTLHEAGHIESDEIERYQIEPSWGCAGTGRLAMTETPGERPRL